LEIVLQRINKLELVKRVIELEKEGWECLIPIQQVRNLHKCWVYREKGLHQNDKRAYNRFSEVSEYTLYKTKMRKDF
jgi:hypothetical protein